MHFPVSGVDVNPLLPFLIAMGISFFTSMGGVSGAFLLLPFQVSFLGFTSPAVSSTNLVYNIVAIPSGVYRYIREGRMCWPLTITTAHRRRRGSYGDFSDLHRRSLFLLVDRSVLRSNRHGCCAGLASRRHVRTGRILRDVSGRKSAKVCARKRYQRHSCSRTAHYIPSLYPSVFLKLF